MDWLRYNPGVPGQHVPLLNTGCIARVHGRKRGAPLTHPVAKRFMCDNYGLQDAFEAPLCVAVKPGLT